MELLELMQGHQQCCLAVQDCNSKLDQQEFIEELKAAGYLQNGGGKHVPMTPQGVPIDPAAANGVPADYIAAPTTNGSVVDV